MKSLASSILALCLSTVCAQAQSGIERIGEWYVAQQTHPVTGLNTSMASTDANQDGVKLSLVCTSEGLIFAIDHPYFRGDSHGYSRFMYRLGNDPNAKLWSYALLGQGGTKSIPFFDFPIDQASMLIRTLMTDFMSVDRADIAITDPFDNETLVSQVDTRSISSVLRTIGCFK